MNNPAADISQALKRIWHYTFVALVLASGFPLASSSAMATEILVAVASNFNQTLEEIAQQFENKTGHKVTVISGSTGKHYAQIKQAAPFDILFAADRQRPALLEQENIALPNSRFTYAIGKLVLWSPTKGRVDNEGKVLSTGDFRYLAMANPKLAPYGLAARQVLEQLGLWTSMQGRLVRGENISQTLHFVESGNAALGFVALPQILKPGTPITGSYWNIPQQLYDPIEQQAVLLKGNPVAEEFLAFVKSNLAREIIYTYGYELP